jgi:hypothetical protein
VGGVNESVGGKNHLSIEIKNGLSKSIYKPGLE